MIQKIISIVIVSLILFSCEEEPDIKEFPIITTLSPQNIDESGATFRGEFVYDGKNEITSYGFTWDGVEPNIKTSEKIVLGTQPSKGIFETRINSHLGKGFEYKIRAFATYNDKTVYGNTVTILSKGSEKSIWSKELTGITLQGWGDTYGFSDGEDGYVIFQDGKSYRFEPSEGKFYAIADFPKSGNSGTQYTSVCVDNIQYVFSSINQYLYKLERGLWNIKTKTPFNYGNTYGYSHGYTTQNKIYLLSSSIAYNYNPFNNAWQKLSSIPIYYSSVGGTDLNGYAYLMDNGNYINEYNPQDDTWNRISAYPGTYPEGSILFERYHGNTTGFSHGNTVYFGFCYGEYAKTIGTSIWGYNLPSNTWNKIEAFPEELKSGEIFYFSIKGKLYIGHGIANYFTIYSLDMSKL
jgi:hypothetical protein